jgi:hypothetical protein
MVSGATVREADVPNINLILLLKKKKHHGL